MALHVPPGVGVDAFFGVFDGHGGQRAADWVSVHLYKFFLASDGFKAGDLERGLREAFEESEREFMKLAMSVDDPLKEMHDGTTAVVVAIAGNKLFVANCGDSEAVLCRRRHALKLTETHNPKDNPEESQRVIDAGGRIYNRRVGHPAFNPAVMSIAVSRSIGDAGFKHERYTKGKPSGLIAGAYVTSTTLTEDDAFVLLACDGLWDVMTPEEAVQMIREQMAKKKDPQTIAELVAEWAYANGSTDNITVLLVSLIHHEPGWTASDSGAAASSATSSGDRLALPELDSDDEDDDAVLIQKLRSRIIILQQALSESEEEKDRLRAELLRCKAKVKATTQARSGSSSGSGSGSCPRSR